MYKSILSQLAAAIPIGTIQGHYGPLTTVNGDPCQVSSFFADSISKAIGVLTAAAVIWFVLQFILGAYEWIGASGDQKALENARTRIIHSIIGLVIVFVALIVVSFIGDLFGFDVLNIGKMINDITPGGGVGNCWTPAGGVGGVGVGTS